MTRPGPAAARTKPGGNTDRLLTVEAAAERMSTSVRFVRRLIAERRIAFVKLGRHVRLTEADVAAFIESGRITPMNTTRTWHNDRRVS